jgi:hypothetical protein
MAYADRNDLNYLGQLFIIGKKQTPLWSMMGSTGRAKQSTSFSFPIAQPWSLSNASQNTQSEATAAAAGTPTTYTRAQDVNTIQIMKYDYEVSYAKQSTYGEISGVAIAGGVQPVTDEMTFQRNAAMLQMAIDIEYSFLQGTYVAAATSATNATTRGLEEAISTNAVAAGSVDLSKAIMQDLFKTVADSGNWGENMILLANSFQKQAISDIYGYAPADRNVGGVDIMNIETDFGRVGVVYANQMSTDTVLMVNMDVLFPVFCPYKGELISDTPTAITAAKEGGFLYTQIGLDYGPEEYHGKITGLTTA